MNRRRVLAAAGGLGATVLAGCLAEGEDPPDQTDTGEPTTPGAGDPSNGDVTPTVLDTTIETTNTECMTDDGETVAATIEDGGVRLDGVARAPTPCHEVTIEAVSTDTDTLRVELGLESTADLCVECVGAIEYGARIDLEGAGGLETVVVDHADPGNTHTVTPGDASTPTGTESPSSTAGDADPDSHAEAMEQPDPDLSIAIANRHDEPHEITVAVTRASGETVFSTTETVEPGAEVEVYNLREADPDGVETFTIEAETGDQVESIEVETSACYGPVEVGVTEDGGLYPVYAIC